MTCIVGLEQDGHVYMGADSAGAEDWEVRAVRIPKLFRRGPFLIGYTDSFRMGQLLQHKLDIPPQNGKADSRYLVCDFVEAVRGCLKDGGFSSIKENVEEGGSFLVGFKDRVYRVGVDFQINSSRDGFQAVGCGRQYALGALWTSIGFAPKDRVRGALRTAAYFSGGVMAPFRVRRL